MTPTVLQLLAVVPFTLGSPEPTAVQPWREPFTEGSLLVLRVDPATRVPTQGLARTWWVGDQPVRTFGFDPAGGCLVAVVEGPVDWATTPVFLGPPELPERVDRTLSRQRLAEAVAGGARPLPPADVAALTRKAAAWADGGALHRAGELEMAACTGAPPPPAAVPLR